MSSTVMSDQRSERCDLARRDTGASAVEYSLVVVAVAVVVVSLLMLLGRAANGSFGSINCWSSSGGPCNTNAAGATAGEQAAPGAPDAAPATDAIPVSCTSNASSRNRSNGHAYGGCR